MREAARVPSFSHADLVARAERWLRNTRRCGVVLTEAGGTGSEIPDAIGWAAYDLSILVECKTSRSDFRADQAKPFRDSRFWDMGVGRFRYYLAPAGLLRPEEIPPRWGLLEAHSRSIRQVVKARRFDLDNAGLLLGIRRESAILLSELRKIQIVQGGGQLWKSKASKRIHETIQRRGECTH